MKKQTNPNQDKSHYGEVADRLQAWQEDTPIATLTEIETAAEPDQVADRPRKTPDDLGRF